MSKVVVAFTCMLYLLCPTVASAWGYQGYEVVGSVADKLLSANAKKQVADILGFARPELRTAGPWADCVKSVARHDDGSFEYVVNPDHLDYEVPCTPFKSADEPMSGWHFQLRPKRHFRTRSLGWL
jgi:hypothetical protein